MAISVDTAGPSVGPELRHWVHWALATLLLGAWGGFAAVALNETGFAVAILVVAIPAYFYCQWRVSRALALEPGLSDVAVARYRDMLLVLGPVIVLRLFVYVHGRRTVSLKEDAVQQQDAADGAGKMERRS